MSKTDKEQTVNLLCSIMNALGTSENSNPLNEDELPTFTKALHKAVSTLNTNSNE